MPSGSVFTVQLTEEEINAIIAIMHFVSTAHPPSVITEDLSVDHRVIQKVLLKMLEATGNQKENEVITNTA